MASQLDPPITNKKYDELEAMYGKLESLSDEELQTFSDGISLLDPSSLYSSEITADELMLAISIEMDNRCLNTAKTVLERIKKC